MDNENIVKLLTKRGEDRLIGLEILKSQRPRLTKEIIGAIYAWVPNSEFEDFMEIYDVKKDRLLPDQTDSPQHTNWSVKYRKK